MNARPLAILLAVLLCAAALARAQVSPTTGAEVPSGRFLPVLVSVGHGYGTARTDGKNVQAAGAGKVALWGLQQADIVYESLLYRDEQKNAASTRLTLLFSDALIRGEAVECGPVRSLRDASALLREEWQGALAFGSTMGAGYLGDAVERLKADSAAAFDIVDIRRGGLGARLQGVKAPSNLSVEVNAVQARVPADSIARPFVFLQESAGKVSLGRQCPPSAMCLPLRLSASTGATPATWPASSGMRRRAATCVRLRVGLSPATPQPGRA